MNQEINLFKKATNADKSKEFDRSPSALRIKVLIYAVTIALCSFFFSFHWNEQVYETKLYNLVPGYIWTDQSIYAKFSFAVYKEESDYLSEVKKAKRDALQVFIYDEPSLANMRNVLDSARSNYHTAQPEANANSKTTKAKNSKAASESFEILEQNRFRKIENLVSKYLNNIYDRGLVSLPIESITNNEISVRMIRNHYERIFTKTDLIDSNHLVDEANIYYRESLNELDAQIALNLTKQLMQPNIVYSQELTNRSKRVAEESVPKTQGIVREGDLVVGKGQPISTETVKKLKSYERAKMNIGDSDYSFLTVLGSIGHSILIYSILILYLFVMRKKIYYNNFQIGMISFFVIFSAFLSWFSLQLQMNLPLEYLVLIPALSTLAAIVLDSRTAFYITVTMSLMFAGIRGNDYDAGTAMLFAGTLAAYTVRDIQSRTQIFKSMLFIFIGFLMPVVFFGLERSAEIGQIMIKLVAVLINSAISPLVTFGLLFVLERFSNITTDLRLQEYNNLNHPLLLKLSENAPGTYQHTIAVAMLAEKCASAINAHELLVKVGAYFHDIGKIVKPEYFVENQSDIGNKHDLLPAKKSASAIRNHVIEGIKIAREYKLPQRIIDFIPMHHGTTLIKYFYAKALEEADDKSTVLESDYRYSGPKPNSKEAAILMICDSAEALSRVAINDKPKLQKLLGDLIHDRILDGQFDECDLNFRDIDVIKDVCIRNLSAASHPRVEYKDIKKD